MASARALVSIGLSMRNSEGTIVPAIRSLLAQSFKDWELLVIDDGSSDRSVELVRDCADDRVQMHRDGRHLGLAARLNQAIDLARGRYFARMDADDIAYPQRLERQVAWLQAHPEIDLLGAGMMVFEAEGRPVGVFPARATHAEICARPAAGFYLAHPTWIGKLEWFKRWRYDPRWLGAEDQDLLLRSFSVSRFAAIPEPLLGYRQNVLSLRKSVRGRYYFSRSLLRAARRNGHILQGLRAVAEQAAKLGWEWVAISSGLSRTLLRHRALPFTPEQAQAWRAVWAACHDASCAVPEKPAAL